MIEEIAQVDKVDESHAEVVVERSTACGSCSAKTGCGTSLLAAWFPQRRLRFRLANEIGAKAGDRVVVGLAEHRLQQVSLALYGLPLIGLLLGAIGGELSVAAIGYNEELGAVAGGLLGLMTGFLLVRRFGEKQQAENGADVILLRTLPRAHSGAFPKIVPEPRVLGSNPTEWK
jgi:sigma-E factor negative regulatory protein RseC